MDIPSIVDSIDNKILENGLSSVNERYYEHKYCNKIEGIASPLDQCISFHSNRVCMLSLAENHPLRIGNRALERIIFEIDERTDRQKNAASGKGKRGAQKLNPESVICYIKTKDGATYPVYSCIKGKLIEINENLIKNPNLLLEKPLSDGYIALLLPILSLYTACKDSMMSREEYLSIV